MSQKGQSEGAKRMLDRTKLRPPDTAGSQEGWARGMGNIQSFPLVSVVMTILFLDSVTV